jgi:hypothetical protein
VGPQPQSLKDTWRPHYRSGKTKQGLPYEELTMQSPLSDRGRFRLIGAKEAVLQEAAQVICKAEGGNLASIHSLAALKALHFMPSQFQWAQTEVAVWIGLYSDGPSQPLKWYDGSAVDFTQLAFELPQKSTAIAGALSITSSYIGGAYFHHLDVWGTKLIICKLQ